MNGNNYTQNLIPKKKLFKLFGWTDGQTDGQTMANSIVPLPHGVRGGGQKVAENNSYLDFGNEPHLSVQ